MPSESIASNVAATIMIRMFCLIRSLQAQHSIIRKSAE
jgi:hypothetical protein